MQENVKEQVRDAGLRRSRRRKFYVLIAACGVLVAGIVSWRLMTSGDALSETYCGQEEHTHTAACSQQVLTCGQEESAGHVHTEACYTVQQVLTCGQEEGVGAHTHTEECYDEEGNLICGQEENAGHVHTEACYTEQQTLTCGQEEGAGAHTHTEACYTTRQICGKTEHTHTEACHSNPEAVETEAQWTDGFAGYEFTGQWGTDAAAIAQTQIGYEESDGNYRVNEDGSTDGYTRYGDWAGDDIYGDWDTYFAAFVLNYAGVPTDRFPVNANDLGQWITAMTGSGYYTGADSSDIQAGDLVVLNKQGQDRAQQIGVISEVETDGDGSVTSIKVVEGNVDNAVVENEYSADSPDIAGYGLVSAAYEAYIGAGNEAEANSGNSDDNAGQQSQENRQKTADSSTPANDVSLQAAPAEGTPLSDAENCSYSVTVETSGGSYEQGESAAITSQSFTVLLEADFSTGWYANNGNQTAYYYKLPDGLSFREQTGQDLTNEAGVEFGTYDLTEDGYLIIRFNDTAHEDYYQVSVEVRGTATANVTTDTEFTFDHGPVIIVENDEGDPNLSEHTKDVVVTQKADGSITYDYTVQITAKEQSLTELTIEDVFSVNGLSINDGDLWVTYNAYQVSLGDDSQTGLFDGRTVPVGGKTFSAKLEESNDSKASFLYSLAELPAEQTLTVRYQITVSADARLETDAGDGWFALGNRAEYFYKDDGEDAPLGADETYSPYNDAEKWLAKSADDAVTIDGQQYVRWTLVAGNQNYALNGLYLTDEIAGPAYEAGVGYATGQPAQVMIYNAASGQSWTQDLQWVEVASLENLTDEQMADNTKIYYCGNEFRWYSATGEGNKDPYVYTLTYYTPYVEDVFQTGGNINGAYAHYEGHISGVEPGATEMAEVELTKALKEVSNDGTVSYVSEITTNGNYELDHFLLMDQLPSTSGTEGDCLVNIDQLRTYVSKNNGGNIGNVDYFKQQVASGKRAFHYYSSVYILVFDSVSQFEEVSGIQVSVAGEDGSALDESDILTAGDSKIIMILNTEADGRNGDVAYSFYLQFNVDIDEADDDLLMDMYLGNAKLVAWEQGYTIRLEYTTTAHKWGDAGHSGEMFINQQAMNFQVPEISQEDQQQWTSAYYFFEAVADSTILNKYISNINETEDGKVTLEYTVNFNLDNIDPDAYGGGLLLIDGVDNTEGVDFSSIQTLEAFARNAKIILKSSDGNALYTFTEKDVEESNIVIVRENQDQFGEFVETISPYDLAFGLILYKSTLDYYMKEGATQVTVTYPIIIDKSLVNLTSGDYSIRNVARLYAADQSGEITAISTGWADYGYTADVLGKYQLQRPNADNGHKASWQILIDPDKLEPDGSTSFTVRDTLSDNQILDPSSVRVYGVGSDGSAGAESEAELPDDAVELLYDPDQNTLAVTVTDTADGAWNYSGYVIRYDTTFQGNPGDTVYYDNTAEIEGMAESEKTVTDSVYIEESSGSAEGTTAAVSVYKYDQNAIDKTLAEADFTLYALDTGKYTYSADMTQEEFLEANKDNWVAVGTGTTDGSGRCTWRYSNSGNNNPLSNIVPGRLFMIVETDPPAGYYTAAPVYGYIPTDAPDDYLQLFDPFTTDLEGTATVYVADVNVTALQIRKVDEEGNPLEGAGFGLYKDEECTEQAAQATVFDGGIHNFGNLEPGIYYLKETRAPSSYLKLDTVLKVDISEEGNLTVDPVGEVTDTFWTAGEDSDGLYIQITNEELYELPETGGIGTAIYLAGGVILMMSSCLFGGYRMRRRRERRGR